MPRSISKDLIAWYRKNKRDLPWRKTADPYSILVSEIMLQQTQVATVVPYYDRFLAAFPTAESLAAATETEALGHWQGLGYYRRLRNLKAVAKVISESGWPDDLQDLPGVGLYTAKALGAFAFGRNLACADGNVRRVMSRLAGVTFSLREAEAASQVRMGSHHALEWNQAVMELGATVCTSACPKCDACPVNHSCIAFSQGSVSGIPVATRRSDTVELKHIYACFLRQGKVSVHKAAKNSWWEGMYVFPYTRLDGEEPASGAAERLGLRSPTHLGTLRHTVTRHKVRVDAFFGSGAVRGAEWFTIDELKRLPLPSPQRRVAGWLEARI